MRMTSSSFTKPITANSIPRGWSDDFSIFLVRALMLTFSLSGMSKVSAYILFLFPSGLQGSAHPCMTYKVILVFKSFSLKFDVALLYPHHFLESRHRAEGSKPSHE